MTPPPPDAGSLAQAGGPVSLAEVHRSVAVFQGPQAWRRFCSFVGPGCLVAVGYMDPGNWATDIAGGSAFGYQLLFVILVSNLIAILLQILALRLGVFTGRDLAQACRENYPRPVAFALWAMAEIGIVATDLAEVIGTAIALQLLFGMPLLYGVVVTVADVLLILFLQQKGFRYLEAFVAALVLLAALCFGFQLVLAQPAVAAVLSGFIPTFGIVSNPAMLYISIGIIGATVMPHNLYLHSAIVQTRRYGRDAAGLREAARFASIDTVISLMLAFALNAAILILAASTFHHGGHTEVAGIEEAHALLAPLLGAPLAAIAFAIALLATGQSSTITATLAGQIVMEGFLRVRMPAWARRLLTRAVAIVPALLAVWAYGAEGAGSLLVFSQVVLSLQLPFAVVPLIHFTSAKRSMGAARSPLPVALLAALLAVLLVGLNLTLLIGAVVN